MSTLKLGLHDTGKAPSNPKEFLNILHAGDIKDVSSFKDEDRSTTLKFQAVSGSEITELQTFLYNAGFMPRGQYESVINGIFDYSTQASLRLFQEYVRTLDPEGDKNMKPDGIKGSGTQKHIDRWKLQNIKADWVNTSADQPSEEYSKWIGVLIAAKNHYLNNMNDILIEVEEFRKDTDTRKVSNWDYSTDEIHLVGIRRNQEKDDKIRRNDDLFILLINGMVFKFWGSTDPSQAMAYNDKKKRGRFDEPFLVEGQHKYRFGWHKSTYRALKPYKYGVLVFRDRDNDNALTESDIQKGLDPTPNGTINIHWSGVGSYNFSAGCQVIAGESYINHHNLNIDCSSFAGRNKSRLTNEFKETKGAYNVLADLVVCFSKPSKLGEKNHLYYTLGREKSFGLEEKFGKDYVIKTLRKMKSDIT
ncbi:hypothetical protein ESY86_13595 [Subsaximicrobium wynnwilliamsii]|uniref:Peptidoglycan-binding protein n=1 Tax=Subsaximicrobium wynnwilliamsii TaxID=291179 RepID=A0A5C6ZGC3_9FLAO|nr:peptidoglycan-binding domain-containing protein [Subsaximicrobium wynnwilliamsii]TXD83219.1 hypothetical protein ESY87_10990 [Subsaximicrobium wynnwilliamsii]TXD88331.1 hypothetical protein ESY86_13595 [Subsaximicrobium wynnwilliamsii]TXE03052.1 hypothetical protein ESY88_10010 [Subsaximicrobium wynnwilliamsii]